MLVLRSVTNSGPASHGGGTLQFLGGLGGAHHLILAESQLPIGDDNHDFALCVCNLLLTPYFYAYCNTEMGRQRIVVQKSLSHCGPASQSTSWSWTICACRTA